MGKGLFKDAQSRPRRLTEDLLEKALLLAGNSKTALSKALGLRLATVCLWYRGIQPAEKNLQKLEKYLASNKKALLKSKSKNTSLVRGIIKGSDHD